LPPPLLPRISRTALHWAAPGWLSKVDHLSELTSALEAALLILSQLAMTVPAWHACIICTSFSLFLETAVAG
jgi:hypothetical protein